MGKTRLLLQGHEAFAATITKRSQLELLNDMALVAAALCSMLCLWADRLGLQLPEHGRNSRTHLGQEELSQNGYTLSSLKKISSHRLGTAGKGTFNSGHLIKPLEGDEGSRALPRPSI